MAFFDQNRRHVAVYPSPNIDDILLIEEGDTTTDTGWAYDDPHPNKRDFPHHKLAYVKAAGDEPSSKQQFYYVVDRVAQDDYNFEVTYPFAGLPWFGVIVRTYVLPRNTYLPLAKGTLDPKHGEPEEVWRPFQKARLIAEKQSRISPEFDSLYVTVQRIFAAVPPPSEQETYNYTITYPYQGSRKFPRITRKYIVPRADVSELLDVVVDRIYGDTSHLSSRVDRFEGDDLDSLYVVVTRVFDTVPNIGDADDLSELVKFGYKVFRPHGTDDFFRLVWSVVVEKSNFAHAVEKTACPIPGYTSLLLVDEILDDAGDEALATATMTREYRSLPGGLLSSEQRLLNAMPPERFIITRKTVRDQQNVLDSATITNPSGSPLDSGGAVLASSLGPDGASLVVFNKGDVREEVTLAALAGFELDSYTGALNPTTDEVVAAGASGSAVASSGFYSTITPVNSLFSIKSTRKATSLAGNSRTYDTIINYSWPGVLQAIAFYPVTAVDPATALEYTSKYRWEVQIKGPYSGPCRATVTESWSHTTSTENPPAIMLPEEIQWEFLLSAGRIGPVLHETIALSETPGNNHPKYPYVVNQKSFAATNVTDWPASIIASIQVTPFRGGFKRTQIVVYKPAI